VSTAKIIRDRRLELGMSDFDVAEKLGFSVRGIGVSPLQHSADRLDPVGSTVLVNEPVHHLFLSVRAQRAPECVSLPVSAQRWAVAKAQPCRTP
jgi:hypothetical protein